MKALSTIFFGLLLTLVTPSVAAAKRVPKRTQAAASRKPASTRVTATAPDAPLQVRGQSRGLAMGLLLKDKDQPVPFIKVRKTFRPEIAATHF